MKLIDKIADRYLVSLPTDIGDGPFASTTPTGPQAATASVEDSSDVLGGDSWITSNPVTGRQDRVSQGTIRISDSIPPGSFRRVYRIFRIRRDHPEDKLKHVWVQFWGNSSAIIEEELGYFAPSTSIASRPAGNPQAPPPSGNWQDRLDTLDNANSVAANLLTPSQSARLSAVNIEFRYPAYEPWEWSDQPMNFSPDTESLIGSVADFNMGNSARETREIEIPYPVGRNMPIIFDMINLHPIQSQLVDFTVNVLLASPSE